MKVAEFLENFRYVVEAPNGVSRLRELIMTLAIQGQLASQDHNDSPVPHLESRVSLQLEPVSEQESRYPIPSSWRWVRFLATGEHRLGKMLDKAKNRGRERPYLRNTNVQWNRFDLSDVKSMKIEPQEEDELLLLAGDLLICEGGEPGRCAIWRDSDSEMFFQKALHRLRPFPEALPEYLAINLNLDARTGVLEQYFTGATIKHLTGRSLARYPIPLPPVEEQQRIVAKVDDLMTLCDKLEERQRSRNRIAEAFSRAAVAATTGTAMDHQADEKSADRVG